MNIFINYLVYHCFILVEHILSTFSWFLSCSSSSPFMVSSIATLGLHLGFSAKLRIWKIQLTWWSHEVVLLSLIEQANVVWYCPPSSIEKECPPSQYMFSFIPIVTLLITWSKFWSVVLTFWSVDLIFFYFVKTPT